MIEERLFQKLPKNVSYKNTYMENIKKKSKTLENQDQKTSKNLNRSAVDQLISTTKGQLKSINKSIKDQQMAEQDAERQKNIGNTDQV